jgi:hypothetical protein
LIVTETVLGPPPEVAVHVNVVPVVSVVTVWVVQPLLEMIADCPSVTDQLTVTLPTYQPFEPCEPFTDTLMMGGVLSVEIAWHTADEVDPVDAVVCPAGHAVSVDEPVAET